MRIVQIVVLSIAALSMLGLAACSNMNRTEQRVVSGTAIGAGTGAVAGALIPGLGIGTGALIGAGAGAVTGLIVDETAED
jgi:hypothetical protein